MIAQLGRGRFFLFFFVFALSVADPGSIPGDTP